MVDRLKHDKQPFLTVGIARVPGGATLRGAVERENLDWHLVRLSKEGKPGQDEVPYEILATAQDEVKTALLDCLSAILAHGQPLLVEWAGGLVLFLPKQGEGGAGTGQLFVCVPT